MHLNEGVYHEPGASFGEIHEQRLEPDPEPVSFPPSVLVDTGMEIVIFRSRFCADPLDRHPLPCVGPGNQATAFLPADDDSGEEVTLAIQAVFGIARVD